MQRSESSVPLRPNKITHEYAIQLFSEYPHLVTNVTSPRDNDLIVDLTSGMTRQEVCRTARLSQNRLERIVTKTCKDVLTLLEQEKPDA